LNNLIIALLANQEANKPPLIEPERDIPIRLGGGSPGVPTQAEPPPSMELPQVASATLLLDLEADTLTVGDGNPASPWLDQSGNSRDFTGNRVFHSDVDGGYVDGNGEDQSMTGLDFGDDLDKFAVFVVLKDLGWGGHLLDKLWASEDNNSYKGIEIISFDGAKVSFLLFDQDGVTSGGIQTIDPITQPSVLTFEKVSNDAFSDGLRIYVDDVLQDVDVNGGGVPVSFSTTEPWRIGLCGGPGGETDAGFSPHAGRAYLIYQITDLDNWATDRAAITAWLADRYNITI